MRKYLLYDKQMRYLVYRTDFCQLYSFMGACLKPEKDDARLEKLKDLGSGF